MNSKDQLSETTMNACQQKNAANEDNKKLTRYTQANNKNSDLDILSNHQASGKDLDQKNITGPRITDAQKSIT